MKPEHLGLVLIAVSILCIGFDRLCSRWQKQSTERLDKWSIIALRLVVWGAIVCLLPSACVLIVQPK